MAAYTTALLDAGDTLWYETRSAVEVWRELLSELGAPRPPERIQQVHERAQQLFRSRIDAFETSSLPSTPADIQRFLIDYDIWVLNELGVEVDPDKVWDRVESHFEGM
jgi:hypothetical protein